MSDEPPASGLDKVVADRRIKLDALRAEHVDPFPPRFDPTHTVAKVRQMWGGLDAGSDTGEVVRVAGRLVAKRGQGKVAFGVLREAGDDVQIFCQLDVLGEAGMAMLDTFDVGDWVGAVGEVVSTQRGELSVRASELTLLGKSLRPLPDKWHGLEDVEQRYRQREMDLIGNAEARRIFAARSAIVMALRGALLDRDFVEVETPMLHAIPSGAIARPFSTHHNALDVDLYLRIAPELFLKRLVVGGMPRVFEIGRSFRNEGVSTRHNPEFTMLEAYQAYADYHVMMDLVQELVQASAAAVGPLEVTYQGAAIALDGEFPRRALLDLVREGTSTPDLAYDSDLAEVRAVCDGHDVGWDDSWGVGKLIVEIYEAVVESTLLQPTFVLDHPVETSPLARRHRHDPNVTERFELIVGGREIANAFSELTDPDDQRARFEAQARARAAGDAEAMVVDEAYLRAMELGMPPTGGLGIGIDRLVMLLTDAASIRDVILFPTLRPEVFD